MNKRMEHFFYFLTGLTAVMLLLFGKGWAGIIMLFQASLFWSGAMYFQFQRVKAGEFDHVLR